MIRRHTYDDGNTALDAILLARGNLDRTSTGTNDSIVVIRLVLCVSKFRNLLIMTLYPLENRKCEDREAHSAFRRSRC